MLDFRKSHRFVGEKYVKKWVRKSDMEIKEMVWKQRMMENTPAATADGGVMECV
jgi:hypothetical protein